MKVVVMLTKVFLNGHPRAGQATHFASSVRVGRKIHTCRDNTEYWIRKIEALKAKGGTLSVREWQDKPYRSPQVVVAGIPSAEVGVSVLVMNKLRHEYEHHRHPAPTYDAFINGTLIDIEVLAKNDGFESAKDFIAFVEPLFNKYQSDTIYLALIHFNNFRY